MKVIIINTSEYCVEREVEIPSLTTVEGMFVKELELCPLAFVYRAEDRTQVEELLKAIEGKAKGMA